MAAQVSIDLTGISGKIELAINNALEAFAANPNKTTNDTAMVTEVGQSIGDAVASSVATALEAVIRKAQDQSTPDMDEMRKQIMANAEALRILSARGINPLYETAPTPLLLLITGEPPALSAAVVSFRFMEEQQFRQHRYPSNTTLKLQARCLKSVFIQGATAKTDVEALRLLLQASKIALDTAETSSAEEVGFFRWERTEVKRQYGQDG